MDGIHTNILKALSEEMSLPLCMIFKKSLDQGVVPFDWRAANVVPLYKKGSKNIPSNYRPVSLTSVVCKILESIIKDAISTHLESNSLIKSSQHGFSSGKSCLTNLLKRTHNETGKECDASGYSQVFFFTKSNRLNWNALPQTAIDAKSINNFKSQLKIHLKYLWTGF